MIDKTKSGEIIIPARVNPWPHEIRVAKILALAGHVVKFIPTGQTTTADILLDNIEYEIKSPKTNNTNTIEHRIKDAIRNQSRNLIIDSSRLKGMTDHNLKNWLIKRCKLQPQIKRMIMVTKRGEIIDIKTLI